MPVFTAVARGLSCAPFRGVVSGRSAAALFGVDVLARRAAVEVTVPLGERLASVPGLVVARSVLESGDVQRWAGVQTTTPLRTAFDIARRPPLFEAGHPA